MYLFINAIRLMIAIMMTIPRILYLITIFNNYYLFEQYL